MNGLDYFVIIAYLAAMFVFGLLLSKQSDEGDYFLGNKGIGWFPLALSTMATQLSAISFISAPAFVGLREGGGLKWLTFEFALPLAMLLVMFVIMPPLYRSGVISIFDFLEQRIGRSTRFFISLSFQIVRAFGTGIMVYVTGLIIEAVLGVPFLQSILAISLITILYSFLGGIRAVVYADAIQMVLIVLGLLVCLTFAISIIGGIQPFWASIDPARLQVVEWSYAGLVTDEFALLPMLFGGFVLYVSYTGLAVGVIATGNSDFLALISKESPDYMMPFFILEYLPNGVIGLLLVAIMSAAMSTLSSAVNSLSAVTIEDLKSFGFHAGDQRRELWLALLWGGLILLFSLYSGDISATVIEAINKVGSALYGPVLGVFLIAILWQRRTVLSTNIGFLCGLFLNLYFWQFQPGLFWMWWNLIGLIVTLAVAVTLSLLSWKMPLAGQGVTMPPIARPTVVLVTAGLSLFTLVIIAISASIELL